MPQCVLALCVHRPEQTSDSSLLAPEREEIFARAAVHYLDRTDEILNELNERKAKEAVLAALYATPADAAVATAFLNATKHKLETIARVHEPKLAVEYDKQSPQYNCASRFWRAYKGKGLRAIFGNLVDFYERAVENKTSRVPCERILQRDFCIAHTLGQQRLAIHQQVAHYAKRVNDGYYTTVHPGQSVVLLVVLEHGLPLEPIWTAEAGKYAANPGEAYLLRYGIPQGNELPLFLEAEHLSLFPEEIPVEVAA